MSTIRSRLVLLVLAVFVVASCSSPEPIQPEATPGPASSEDAEASDSEAETSDSDSSNSGGADSGSGDSELGDSDASASEAGSAGGESEPEPDPTLADEDLASIENLQAGEQVQDAQGNVIAVYGIATWSENFEAMPADTRAQLPVVIGLEALRDPSTTLMALDVAVCTAGINVVGSGTAEFFVHDNADDPLAGEGSSEEAGVLFINHPVADPGFEFPPPAECSRGWLPVVGNGSELPTTARYVLATRSENNAEIERYVYQWEIVPTEIDPSGEEVFQPGETVTFNEGALADTTVRVDGWAELIGEQTIEGGRNVAVLISFCLSTPTPPNFGLAIDGWNVVAPIVSDGLIAEVNSGSGCAEGWLRFMVPHGGVPTAFFATDGSDPINGYAEWSLENAALAAPQ